MTRRYGQHFLTDENLVRKIVEASGIRETDSVLEIGPGRGVLTRALAEHAGKVLAVELDRHLFADLTASELADQVQFRQGNILDADLVEMKRELGPYHVVANLPYEVTSDILRKFLPDENGPETMTVMVQKEVGERIVAKKGKMSRLSLFCGYYSRPELLFNVPRGAFSPPPKVDSCIVRFELKKERPLPPAEEKRFFALIEAAFLQKRKKIGNTLKKKLGPEARSVLQNAGIDPNARPEDILPENWVSLASKS